MRREMLRWVGFTAGSAFVAGALLAPAADAAVVICKRKNNIQLRETACKSKETQIAATELGATGPQGPQGSQGLPGTVGPAGPGAAWALVDKDGTVLAQSGGLSVTAGPAASYLVGFGASMSGKTLVATSAFTSSDGGLRGEPAVALCGTGPQAITGVCTAFFSAGVDDDHHLIVITGNAGDTANEQHPFYISVF